MSFSIEHAAKKCAEFWSENFNKKVTTSGQFKVVIRKWKFKINEWRKMKNQSGNGYVKPLESFDQTFMNMMDRVVNVAKGKKVDQVLLSNPYAIHYYVPISFTRFQAKDLTLPICQRKMF